MFRIRRTVVITSFTNLNLLSAELKTRSVCQRTQGGKDWDVSSLVYDAMYVTVAVTIDDDCILPNGSVSGASQDCNTAAARLRTADCAHLCPISAFLQTLPALHHRGW